jgi:hypothetical protein
MYQVALTSASDGNGWFYIDNPFMTRYLGNQPDVPSFLNGPLSLSYHFDSQCFRA